MNNRSFANRLTWRIIGIVSVIVIISFIMVGAAMQYFSAHEVENTAPWRQILDLILLAIVGLTVLFFLCRRMIRRMARPITELSVSAMNMANGNFKAKLPQIDTKDEIRRLHDSFLYLENSITDYISQLKMTKSDNERMESELNVARTIQMGMLSTDFPPQLHALVKPAKEVGGDLYDFIRKGDVLHFAVGRNDDQRVMAGVAVVHVPSLEVDAAHKEGDEHVVAVAVGHAVVDAAHRLV